MTPSDWGPFLHCDLRRVRVVAESLFSASVTMDEFNAPVRGRIKYFVPPTSLLCADPKYLFFRDVDSRKMPVQTISAGAQALVRSAQSVGVLRTLWPNTDPIITETWLATRHNSPAIASIPVKFEGPREAGAALKSRATARIPGDTQ